MGAAAKSSSPAPAHITLNLPIPPSVNRTRRIDWAGDRARREFYLRADLYITAHGPRPAPVRRITGPYEIKIQIPASLTRMDLDNHCKCLIDYLVSREFVPDDSKRYLQRLIVELVVEWTSPSPACRVTINSLSTNL
jgi:Holliday junction resolvase RusA-like endonuclease